MNEKEEQGMSYSHSVNFNIETFAGLRVVLDKNAPCGRHIRTPHLPKTRKRRIRKKWEKKYPQTTFVLEPHFYRFYDMLIMHPLIFLELRKEISTIKEGQALKNFNTGEPRGE